jgi:PAS domain S-box-containing protein
MATPHGNELKTTRGSVTVAAIFLLLLYCVWLLWGGSDLRERLLLGSLTLVFTAMAAVFLAYRTSELTVSTQYHSAWFWVAVGLGINALGDLGRFILEVLQIGSPTFQQVLELFFPLAAIALTVGMIRYPRATRTNPSRVLLFIDVSLTTIAVITIVWLAVIQPVFAPLRFNFSPAIFSVIMPVIDLAVLILLMILFLVNDAKLQGMPMLWITIGLLAFTISDFSYSSQLLAGSYTVGSLVDLGWVIGDCAMILAALSQLTPKSNSMPAIISGIFTRLQSLLPLLSVLILGWYSLLTWQISGGGVTLGFWVTIILGLGLIARQGVTAGEVEFRQYASLVNSLAEPAFVCDNRGRLRLVNPALQEITGSKTVQDLTGLSLGSIIPIELGTGRLTELRKSGGWTGETTLIGTEGEKIPILLSLRPVQPGGSDRLSLAGTAHDLREQKQQQAALQSAYEQLTSAHDALEAMNAQLEQKVAEKTANLSEAYAQLEQQNLALQKLDQLKSDFVALVSHELRAPLTNINGGIELVLSRQLPAKTVQTLELVEAEITRLTRFVETILDISALDAGRIPLYPGPVSIESISKNMQQQMLHLEGATRISWELRGRLPDFLADEKALNSILFHLLDNALKYAPEGKIIVEAGTEKEKGWIAVSDEGAGLPEEAIPFLFDRFYRYNTEDAKTIYGHGMGLYIVKRLVEAMDGIIEVENLESSGARFTCWLPLVKTSEGKHA